MVCLRPDIRSPFPYAQKAPRVSRPRSKTARRPFEIGGPDSNCKRRVGAGPSVPARRLLAVCPARARHLLAPPGRIDPCRATSVAPGGGTPGPARPACLLIRAGRRELVAACLALDVARIARPEPRVKVVLQDRRPRRTPRPAPSRYQRLSTPGPPPRRCRRSRRYSTRFRKRMRMCHPVGRKPCPTMLALATARIPVYVCVGLAMGADLCAARSGRRSGDRHRIRSYNPLNVTTGAAPSTPGSPRSGACRTRGGRGGAKAPR